MEKKSVYLNQRIRRDTMKKLRKFERQYRRNQRSSVSEAIELLLLGFNKIIYWNTHE